MVATKGAETSASAPTPPSIDELRRLRTDFEDVSVDSLGGTTVRLWAMTGVARASLMSDMVSLSKVELDAADVDPETVERVMLFSARTVAASMGYPPSEWDGIGNTLGQDAIEQLYEVAARLSKLAPDAADKDADRLQPRRKAASGTG